MSWKKTSSGNLRQLRHSSSTPPPPPDSFLETPLRTISWKLDFTFEYLFHIRCVGIARLHTCTNLGEDAEEIQFFILVLCPTAVKGTKSALELGRTFATLFSNMDLRHALLECHTPDEFKSEMRKFAEFYGEEEGSDNELETVLEEDEKFELCQIGRGVREDLATRIPFLWSDYKDGVVGNKAIQKTCSTTLFLYFSVILPAIAFGNLQHDNTDGRINVEKVNIVRFFFI